MSERNINFNDKKINKSNFCKNRNVFKIHGIDVNKILVSKREYLVIQNYLNSIFDIMTMITLDRCV